MNDSFETLPDFTDDYSTRVDSAPVLTVKEMDSDDQPRERARKYGIRSLSTADLFAIILRTGTKGYPITTLCRDLMKMNDNKIANLVRCPLQQLMLIKGVGELKAWQILAVMEIVRRHSEEKIGPKPLIRESKDIYALMHHEIGNLPNEEIWMLFLNRGNRVTGKMRLSSGGAAASVFDLKRALKSAILAEAQGVVLCHNHPSGTLSPSGPDDQITRRLAEGCRQLDILLLDHVIVTADSFYSYNDSGRLPR